MHTLVDIVFIQDWDSEYDEQKAEGNSIPEWGEWEAIAEYLTQWDYGDETDAAHSTEYDDNEFPWGYSDDTMELTINGLFYILSFNRDMHYVGLQRPVMGNWKHPMYWEAE